MSGTYKLEELVEPAYSQYSRFERKLSDECLAEARALRGMLTEHGHRLAMPHSKKLGNGVHELRGECHQTPLRIYYFWCKTRNSYILASAEHKKGDADQNLINNAARARKAICGGRKKR